MRSRRVPLTGLAVVVTFTASPLFATLVGAATRTFTVTATAMAPTLVPDDRVIVNTSPRSIDSGDVVVFRRPPAEDCGGSPVSDEVMRIIGLPGDTVEARHDKAYLNGRVLPEPWLPAKTDDSNPYTANYGPVAVPEGGYFVMGDNRTRSRDSRVRGPVKRS